MFIFRSCPRCGGDMYLDRDIYGTYKECIQCGFSLDVEVEKATVGVEKTATVEKKVAA